LFGAKNLALERLGSSLYDSVKRIFRVSVIDKTAIKDLIRDLQRSLLQADVNVNLVLNLSQKVEERSLKEKIPPGISRREHIIKVVYEEISFLLGEKNIPLNINPNRKNVFLLVGIQGSGKTTTAAKLSRFFQKKGLKTSLICVDTFRPGAFAQLKQLAKQINVPIYGDEKEKNPVKIAIDGLKKFENQEVVIIDTSGRHKDEERLIKEMKTLEKKVKPTEVILVIDGTIGQQAFVQAKAFKEAASIGSIIVSKLDGSARGGGAISAAAATGAAIKFVGIGEKIDAIERFDPPRFVGRLLGMGDLQTLLEKVQEAEIKVPKKKAKAILGGKFNLTDMYDQFKALEGMGPFNRILKMIPGFGHDIPKDMTDMAENNLKKWKVIIQSMTTGEKENPKTLNSSRIRRIARGSGTKEKDVKSLVEQFSKLKRMMKTFRRRGRSILGRRPPF
jgi:signal recognition particle subunit SRP54